MGILSGFGFNSRGPDTRLRYMGQGRDYATPLPPGPAQLCISSIRFQQEHLYTAHATTTITLSVSKRERESFISEEGEPNDNIILGFRFQVSSEDKRRNESMRGRALVPRMGRHAQY